MRVSEQERFKKIVVDATSAAPRTTSATTPGRTGHRQHQIGEMASYDAIALSGSRAGTRATLKVNLRVRP